MPLPPKALPPRAAQDKASRDPRPVRHRPPRPALCCCMVPLARMLLFFSMLLSANVQAGERVDVRAAIHPDHARLVLDWLSPVTVERRTTNGGLTLRFDRPLEADLGAAAVRLGSHVTALSASVDGKELLIGLRSGVVLKRFRQFDPDLVVMDFIRASARPQALQGAAAIRIGQHDGYRRLVLDFAAPVVHEVTRNGRNLILTFGRSARIDAASLAPEVEPFVDEVRPFQEERPGLDFRLRPKIEAEVFALDEDKIVIDFRTRGLERRWRGEAPGMAGRRRRTAPVFGSLGRTGRRWTRLQRRRRLAAPSRVPPDRRMPISATTGDPEPTFRRGNSCPASPRGARAKASSSPSPGRAISLLPSSGGPASSGWSSRLRPIRNGGAGRRRSNQRSSGSSDRRG